MAQINVPIPAGRTDLRVETLTPQARPVLSRSLIVRKICRLVRFALYLLLACNAFASSRQKTDIIYMLNGDKITGEIQSLTKGQLSIKPDYASSSILLDWTKVDHLESSQLFVITDPRGNLYAGSLTGGTKKQTLTVVKAANTTLPHESVIEISELGSTFLKRLSGNISVGTSFTQSNAQKNLTVQSGLSYQSQQHIFTLTSDSQFASQEKTNDTNETTAKTAYFRQLHRSDWYGGAIANFLSSSEQKIALQSTLGAALAKHLIFTNRTNLSVIGGIGYTVQRDASGAISTGHTHSADSAFSAQFSTFRFDTTTFNTTFWVYPSLTSPGHVRTTLNQDIYYKFSNNLYVSVSFYDNYDTQPVVGAPANNMGASTAVGWSFH
jgi:hypothetical protein